ncbi:MAG TPA: hypothetical protein VGM39_09800 [Kofleriaceae bacterium]|jgi:hypothetical protein
MNRWETESTARINRLALGQLLDTMTPAQEQPITARVQLSDVHAALADEAARDSAVTTPMPSAVRGTQTLRMGMRPPEAAPIETPILAVGTGVSIAIPARHIKGIAVSATVAAIVLIAFFAVYLCI